METEEVTQAQLNSLLRCFSPMGARIARLHEVDLSRGRGILEGRTRCLWTRDGKKITISQNSDG